jgi:hypothetical protein
VGHGAGYSCPRGRLTTTNTTEAYVDNSTDFINDYLERVPWTDFEFCEELTDQSEEWEGLLSTSGGRLELPKCLAYIIMYEFVNGEPK